MRNQLEKNIFKNKHDHNLHLFPAFLTGKLKAFLLLSMLLIGSISLQTETAAQSLAKENQSQPAAGSSAVRSSATIATSYADIVEKVTPAVVTVRSEKRATTQTQESPFSDDPRFRDFFERQFPQLRQTPRVQRGMGSGVIVESNGFILTNNHVVNGSSRVRIELSDRRIFDAKVVGTDAASDLAVLKIEAAKLPTLVLGDSDKVRVGDVVLAIGNPLGLRQTVTSGIISAKGRQTGLSDGSFEDFLQTDAPINQGNSGGALVNLNGELVGINSQILSPSGGSIGLGFSIPSNMAKSVMTQLIRNGKVQRGQLGVGIQDVNSDLADNLGLKEVRGVIVNSVTANGPAARAGIKQGDIIHSLDGTRINDGNELRNRVAQAGPNKAVTVGILRDGQELSVQATLGEFQTRATATREENRNANDEPATEGKLGLSLEPLTPELAGQLKIKETDGLVVRNVQAGSPADDAGIVSGDVILQVNRQPARSVAALQTILANFKGNSVLLLISRGGQNLFVTVRV
jgi:serine protease Do